MTKNADSRDDCGDAGFCGEQGERDRLAALEAADLATVGAITGGAFLAAGIVLFVLGAPSSEQATLAASPSGVLLRGAF